LVETASYLVDLDKYARRLEDESRTLFGKIRDATVDARQYQPCCVQLKRENSTLRSRVRQLEQSLDRATTVLLQSERERMDTREELLHVREDLRRLIVSQNRLKDRLQSKDDLLTVRSHLLSCERNKVEKLEKNRAENVTNLAWLTRTAVYLRDKAERLRWTWEDADSLCVDELTELNRELPVESQHEIRTETSSCTSPVSSFTCARWLGCRPPSRLRRFERHTPWCPGSFRRTTPLRTVALSRTRGLAPSIESSEGMT
jgi:acetone carboxylase gamma subunit